MAGRRARTGRGWDAAPPRARRSGAQTKRPVGDEVGEPSGSDGAGRSAGTAPTIDPQEQAREICLRQLAVRPRTRAELAAALAKRGVDDDVASAVLDRYADVGLIDDAAFARAWVTSRHHGRGLARRALASELRQRGVESELVSEALGELDDETEVETARSLVERKLRGMGAVAPDAVFRRLASMLARKGYPPGIVFGVVKEALASRGQEIVVDEDVPIENDAELG